MKARSQKKLGQPESEERVFARERFRVQLQTALHNLMKSRGISQRELARRLGSSEASVGKMFNSECLLDMRTLGEVFHALDCTPEVSVHDGVLRLSSDRLPER